MKKFKFLTEAELTKMDKKRLKSYRQTIYREQKRIEHRYVCDCCGEIIIRRDGLTMEQVIKAQTEELKPLAEYLVKVNNILAAKK